MVRITYLYHGSWKIISPMKSQTTDYQVYRASKANESPNKLTKNIKLVL